MIRNLKSAIQNPKSLGGSAQRAGESGQSHQMTVNNEQVAVSSRTSENTYG
jgi:hypothetical protein